MKIIYAPDAERDLEKIADHISSDNPSRAESFVSELDHKARQLRDFPRRFPLVPEFADLDIRHRVHGNYVILYRVEDDHIFVLRFMHAAQDYDAWFSRDE